MVKPPPKTYKQRKEDFVSNHYGGSISEINLVTAVGPASYILYCVLQSRLRFFTPYGRLQFLCDFILNSLAILFSVTVYSSFPALLNVLILTPAILIYLTNKAPSQRKVPPEVEVKKGKGDASTTHDLALPKKAFLTVYRGGMMAITCVAILAVDFKAFPRRFAKVENWGTSLMDLGVGSFVFSSGVVSARVVLKEIYSFQQSHTGKVKHTPVSSSRRVTSALKGSLPLLILGFIRLGTVKATDYAEHISEYGYHWNFFFTLAFLPPSVHLFQSLLFLLPKRYLTIYQLPFIYATLAILVAGIYQAVLETTGLKTFILIGDRDSWGLIGWNKEGLFSFFGYLAIFLAGMSSGSYLLPLSTEGQPTATRQGSRAMLGPLSGKLISWSIFWILAFLISWDMRGLRLQVSRRLANLPYVLWIVAFNTTQITAFYLIEWFFFGPRGKSAAGAVEDQKRYELATPKVLEAFNKEGLPIFLVANVLTGLINLAVNTLDMTDSQALGILVPYAFVLNCAAMALAGTQWRKAVGRYLAIVI